jgi:Ca2+-binding RTX toxin-like protein
VSALLRAIGVAGLLLICIAVVATAANTVPASNLGSSSQAITANTLKPAACNGITLTSVVIGNNGTAGADLLLGSAGVDNMDGNGGDDCILGGGGNDNLRGSGGNDVCIGGPGTDTFHPSCEGQIP